MKVLSLFDGISCGMLALKRAGFQVEKYYASEIDRDAITVSKKNFPEIIQLGDICGWWDWNIPWGEIELVIAGSPCQGFSIAGKKLNFEDERSKLFFEFADILDYVKYKNKDVVFLLENVCMKKEWVDIISERLGAEPILINSSLVSAQNRKRLYWTNIKGIRQPKDKGILLKDILEFEKWLEPGKMYGKKLNKAAITGRRINKNGCREDDNKLLPILQCLEVSPINADKSNCITTVDKDNVLTPLPFGRYADVFNKKLMFRYYTLKEYCRLQNLPVDYFYCISESAAKRLIGNCWTVDIIKHIFSYM